MYKNLLKFLLVVAILAAGGISVQAKNWKIDFTALGAKYVDKTGVTISEAVTANVGTCSIVNGTLVTPIEVEEGDPITTDSEELNQNFTLQTGTTWLVRSGGLYSSNGGGRKLALLNCEAGQTIKMAISIAPTLDATDVAEFDMDNSADGVYIYKVNTDGDVFFTITRYSYITSIAVENTEWEIDFLGLGEKYVDKTGVTISAAVTSNVGTCSIVNGTLKTPIEVEEGDPITTDSEDLDERFTLQTGTNWLVRPGGLYSSNGGGRVLAIRDARKDQSITMAINIAPALNSDNAELKSNADGVYVYIVKEDGDVFFNITRYSYITKIVVANVQGVNYTVKFVDEQGNTLKDDAIHKGEVGESIELTASDQTSFFVGDVKYLFKESDVEGKVITEDGLTVVTVVFRPAKTCQAILTCKNTEGTTIKQFGRNGEYTFLEGDSYTIYPPVGIKFNDAYYFCPVNSYHGTTADISSTNAVHRGDLLYYMITKSDYAISAAVKDGYNYTAGQDSVAYYAEVEDLTLFGEAKSMVGWTEILYGAGHYFDRFSQGCGPRLTNGSYFYTDPIEEAATYKVSIYLRNGSSSNESATYGLRDAQGEVSIFDIETTSWGSAGMGWENIEVGIPAGSSFVIMNNGTAGDIDFDAVSMTKVGDYAETPLVTGITSVQKSTQLTGTIYNLQGQVVKNAQKGLYIQNGKKFIVK